MQTVIRQNKEMLPDNTQFRCVFNSKAYGYKYSVSCKHLRNIFSAIIFKEFYTLTKVKKKFNRIKLPNANRNFKFCSVRSLMTGVLLVRLSIIEK